MAKDPAFLFYYDRFLSGTMTMTNEEVGQYIRLMCLQANKGFITEKDMLHICGTLETEVLLKFSPLGDGTFANEVLTETINQRKAFTESRRKNREGKKNELVKNTSETYDEHMVNVNVNKDNNIKGVPVSREVWEQHVIPNLRSNKEKHLYWFKITGKTWEQLSPLFEKFVLLQLNAENFMPAGEVSSHFINWLSKNGSNEVAESSGKVLKGNFLERK